MSVQAQGVGTESCWLYLASSNAEIYYLMCREKIRIHFNVGCYLAFGRKEQKVVTDELIGQRALLTVGYWLHHRMIPVDLIQIIWLHRQ